MLARSATDAGTKRCRGIRLIAALTRSSSVALPSSSLARSVWIAITSTMCLRRTVRCSSFIGFMTVGFPQPVCCQIALCLVRLSQ